jgi:hypothetical protein
MYRRGVRVVLAGLAILGAAVGVTVAGAGPAAATATPWTVSYTNSGLTALTSIACPSTTTCYALDATSVAVTVNDGTSWSPATVNASSILDAIACPSASECYAAGESNGSGAVFYSTNTGGTWASVPGASSFASVTNVLAIACPSALICYAVGSSDTGTAVVEVTGNGGSTWTSDTLPVGLLGMTAVTCTSTTACYAAGSTSSGAGSVAVVLATVNGGTSWSQQYEEAGSADASSEITALSCPTASTCYAAGSLSDDLGSFATTAATADAGAIWNQVFAESGAIFAGLACPSASTCYVSGSSPTGLPTVVETSDGFVAASDESIPTVPALGGLACTQVYSCFAAATNSDGTSAAVVTNAVTTPIVATSSLPDAVTGTAYSATLQAAGGTSPYTWSITAGLLPAGLSLNASSGAITGTPTGSGTVSFTVQVSDAHSTTATSVLSISSPWFVSASYPAQPVTLTSIACPSTSVCLAVDPTGPPLVFVTLNGGGTWDEGSPPASLGVAQLGEISCFSVTACVAAGLDGSGDGQLVGITDNDGVLSFSVQLTMPGDSLTGVSCPSSADCYAVGSDGEGNTLLEATTNSGSSWTAQTPPAGTFEPAGVSCPNVSTCYAAVVNGSVPGIITTSNGGSTWKATIGAIPSDDDVLAGISCSSSVDCVTVGVDSSGAAAAVGTSNSGTTWTDQVVPGSLGELSAVSCPIGGTTCVSEGPGFISGTSVVVNPTADTSGSSWTQESIPQTAGTLIGLDCISATTCESVGSTGATATSGSAFVMGTTDAGNTWTVQALPAGASNFDSISCPSATTCFAAGSAASTAVVATTTDSGAAWAISQPPGMASLTSIACPSASDCYAIGTGQSGDTEIVASTDGGNTWTATDLGGDIGSPDGIACVSATSCLAVGGNDFTTTTDGTDWASPTTVDGEFTYGAVSCFTASLCVAVGGLQGGSESAVAVTTNMGGSWTDESPPAQFTNLTGVSCPSATVCFASGSSSDYGEGVIESVDSGADWTTLSLGLITSGLSSISCASATVCDAADGNLVLATADGGNDWFPETVSAGANPDAVACPSPAGCFIAGTGSGITGGVVESDFPTPPLKVSTTPLAPGIVGQGYSANLQASGGDPPYTWAITVGSLPAGLSLNDATGVITGTPTTAATSPFTVKATDSSPTPQTATGALSISVLNATTTTVTVTSTAASTPTQTTTGESVTYAATVSSSAGTPTGSVAFSIGSTALCSGTLNGSGVASCSASTAPVGTETVAGNYASVAPYAASSGVATLTVNPAPSITTTTLLSGSYGVPYSQTLAASGGTAPFTWSISSATPPSWLILNPSTGAITGTPTAESSGSVTFEVKDAVGATATQAITVTVAMATTTTTLTLTPTTVTYGAENAETFKATVVPQGTGTPTGTVAVKFGATTLCTITLGGTDTCPLAATALAAGSPSITGVYSGDGNFGTSTSSAHTLTVAKAPTATSVTLSVTTTLAYGKENAEKFSVAVTGKVGPLTGIVAIKTGTFTICSFTLTTTSAGKGSCSPATTTLNAGKYTNIVADYEGTADLAPSTSIAHSVTVSKVNSGTALTLSASSVVHGKENVEKFSVSVAPQYAGVPTGTVEIKEGTVILCKINLVAGKGSCLLGASTLAVGKYTVVADYGGSVNFNASDSVGHALTVVA